jgi:hypothetical protein
VRDYERRFWELWYAHQQLRELALEQRDRLAQAVAAQKEAERLAEERHAYTNPPRIGTDAKECAYPVS